MEMLRGNLTYHESMTQFRRMLDSWLPQNGLASEFTLIYFACSNKWIKADNKKHVFKYDCCLDCFWKKY